MEEVWKQTYKKENFKNNNYQVKFAIHCFIKVLDRFTYVDFDWSKLKNIEEQASKWKTRALLLAKNSQSDDIASETFFLTDL